jgi:glycine cleavage system aminomethyltransferase T
VTPAAVRAAAALVDSKEVAMNALDTAARPAAKPTSSTLYFGPWYRRSPFFEKTLEAGCSAYDIYNHMYLPGYYADPIEEYWALLNDVTVWDVSVERIVEITGPDASAFTNMLTCRDLTKCAVGQGKYVLITADDGGIVNDPVLLRVEENRWWLALADSDAGLYARGVAVNSGLDVKVREPEIYPIQVQGPKSRDTLRNLFGPAIDDIKYYWTLTTEVDGIPVVISRTGWTGEVGYEVYLRDPSRGGDLWDRVFEAGREFNIRPVAPVEARRIEAGIFNYGSDMTIANNPFEVMGLERLVEPQEADYIGKAALEEIRAKGVSRKLVGIESTNSALQYEIAEKRPVLHRGESVGTLTDLIWSPRLERNIGYVWLPIELSGPGTELEIVAPDGALWSARSAAIPFLDARKQVPLGKPRASG